MLCCRSKPCQQKLLCRLRRLAQILPVEDRTACFRQVTRSSCIPGLVAGGC